MRMKDLKKLMNMFTNKDKEKDGDSSSDSDRKVSSNKVARKILKEIKKQGGAALGVRRRR